MIELLPLVLLIFLLVMQRKTNARVAALEDEVKVLREALSGKELAAGAVAAPWASEDAAAGRHGSAGLPGQPDAVVAGQAGAEGGTEPAGAIGAFGQTETAGEAMAARETLGDQGAGHPGDGPATADANVSGTEEASPSDRMAKGLAGMRESFESNIGARWPVWVGGVALALGGIFLVRYSIEAGLLGPAARLALAAGFGLLLLILGEVIRRRGPSAISALPGFPLGRTGSTGTEPTIAPSTGPSAALPPGIPGVLTAAGALTLIGAIYAAYDIYQFIGPGLAFVLLAVVSLGTVALSLLHGQALAGLGLLGSLATPALTASSDPNIIGLFAFLALTFLAVSAASRLRGWTVVPALANLGIGFWVLFYLAVTTDIDPVPPALALIVMIGGTAFLWPGSAYGRRFDEGASLEGSGPEGAGLEGAGVAGAGPEGAGLEGAGPEGAGVEDAGSETGGARGDGADGAGGHAFGGLKTLLRRPPLKISLTASLMAVLSALGLTASIMPGSSMTGLFAAAAVIAALAAYGATSGRAVWAAIIAGIGAVLSIALTAADYLDFALPAVIGDTTAVPAGSTLIGNTGEIAIFLGLGAIFTLLGLAAIRRYRFSDPVFATVWAFLAPAVPLAIAVISFFNFGHLGRDWSHGLYALAIGLVMLAAARFLSTASVDEDRASESLWSEWPAHLAVTGAFAGFTVALHALSNGIVTTLLVSFLGFAFLLAGRRLPWPALPWMMPLAILVVFGRIAWDPTLVGAAHLGKTPFLNALLPGYGIPALLAILAAYLMRQSADLRLKNVLQALASLSGLMAIAILVRHAMNGGTLDASVPTLAEQSLYTLLTIAFSGVLMTLDRKSPSLTFRYGSMIAGVIATLNVLSLHIFALNPAFTGEGTGAWPFINLLLIGYLLPAIAYGIVAWYARGRRPIAYVAMLGISGAVLGFLWATLSVRRFFQGPNIDLWKGFGEAETYSYSVVWLLIGVALLALGSRLEARA